MTISYLADANVLSEPLRPAPSHTVIRKLRSHETQTAIPSVAWHELRFGFERLPPSRRRDAMEAYLAEIAVRMPIFDYDGFAAEWHAAERARLAARGETPPYADGQIAAIAAVHDLILVTFNVAHFRRFKGLRLVDWR